MKNEMEFSATTKYGKNGKEKREFFVNGKQVNEKTYSAMIGEYGDSEKSMTMPQILNIVVNDEKEKFAIKGMEEMAESFSEKSAPEIVQLLMKFMHDAYQMGMADAYEDMGVECMRTSARLLAGEDLEGDV